jgi:cell filamentation protein
MIPAARDPYVYPGTNVLINSGDYRVQAELNQFEEDAVLLAFAAMKRRRIQGPFNIHRLQETHRRIFSKVYPWAGELRKDIGLMAKNRSALWLPTGHRRIFPEPWQESLRP